MKKIFNVLMGVLLFLPFVVKADLGMPYIDSYEAVVITDDAQYYDFDGYSMKKEGTIPKDSKIEVQYEMEEDKEVYLGAVYKNNNIYIKAKDVAPLNEEVDYKKYAVENKYKFKVYESNGVEVRKGPSVVYDSIGTLKEGTVGTVKGEMPESVYIYVETDDLSGWISTQDAAVFTNDRSFVVVQDLKTSCGTIPAYTEFNRPWVSDVWSDKMEIEYKGCKDTIKWFKRDELLQVSYETYTKTKADIEVYEKIDGKKVAFEIPAKTEINFLGTYYDNNGKVYFYVLYNGKKGWVKESDREIFGDFYVGDDISEEEPEDEDEPEDTDKKDKKKHDDDDDEDEEKMDSKTIVLICVIGGVAFALGALVSIVLVNKKNKKKEEQLD